MLSSDDSSSVAYSYIYELYSLIADRGGYRGVQGTNPEIFQNGFSIAFNANKNISILINYDV